MQHEHHRVPVTAVSLWREDVVFFAEGGRIKAYDLTRKALLAEARVFEGQAVHGILHIDNADGALLLIWGGKYVRLFRMVCQPDRSMNLEPGNSQEASDWILDGAFSPPIHNRSPGAALVTAHNALLFAMPCDLNVNIRTVVAGSNCILYCSHATWLSPSKCLIASGTAFGNVVLWSCTISTDEDNIEVEKRIHFNFCAHEGSVFGLQLAPPGIASAFGGATYVLASCSDDRTVRIWDISDLRKPPQLCQEAERETGFGHVLDNQAGCPPLLCKAMGHLSRIWHVRFYQSLDASGQSQIVTFGEDAAVITWAVETGAGDIHKPRFNLRQLYSQRAHSGKNLWAVSVNPNAWSACGGADGAISWRVLSNSQEIMEVETPPPASGFKPDHYRAYEFIGPNEIAATTNNGRLLLLKEHADGKFVTTDLPSPSTSLHGYSILASLADVAFFGGADGIVYSYRTGDTEPREMLRTERKLTGLFAQLKYDDAKSGRLSRSGLLLVTNVATSSASLCHICWDEQVELKSQPLTLSESFIVTSFASSMHGDDTVCVLGSRSGLLAIFSSRGDRSLDSSLITRNAHNGEAVTCLRLTDKRTKGQKTQFLLYSTGRDGTYAVHDLIIESDNHCVLNTVHRLSLSFGSNVEGLGYAPTGDLLVWGFRSKTFVVFNVTRQEEIMIVDCGGVHRNWCYQPSDQGGLFLWTKASKMYCVRQNEVGFRTLNAGGHGREIKAATVSPSNARLIATGAEDTDIKLTLYDGTFHSLHTLQGHNTGIQHMQWSPDGRLLFSTGGFEEFFVWRVTPGIQDLNVGVTCEAKHPRSGSSDLRIMSFDVRLEAPGQLCDTYHILTIYSDSSIRIWRYASADWSLLASGEYLTSCLTQCEFLSHSNNMITGSTDGHLVGWKGDLVGGELQWRQRHSVHQNAIMCMAMHELQRDCQIVLTGGDDNAIGVTRISGVDDFRSLVMPKAHAAAITAIKLISYQPGNLRFVSAGLDQRIKLWQLEIDLQKPGVEGMNITMIQNVFSAVADISSIDSVHTADGGNGLLVCGVGMDIWRLPGPYE